MTVSIDDVVCVIVTGEAGNDCGDDICVVEANVVCVNIVTTFVWLAVFVEPDVFVVEDAVGCVTCVAGRDTGSGNVVDDADVVPGYTEIIE